LTFAVIDAIFTKRPLHVVVCVQWTFVTQNVLGPQSIPDRYLDKTCWVPRGLVRTCD